MMFKRLGQTPLRKNPEFLDDFIVNSEKSVSRRAHGSAPFIAERYLMVAVVL